MQTRDYKVADLATILGVAPKTIYKYIEKGELITIQCIEKGRKVTKVTLTKDDLLEFKEKYFSLPLENESNHQVNESNCEEILTSYEVVNESKQDKTIEIIDKITNFTLQVTNQHNNQLKEYIDRVIESEKQVKLLEDIEKRKENEYLRQISEYKTKFASLEKENTELKQQLEQERNKPFWKKKVL